MNAIDFSDYSHVAATGRDRRALLQRLTTNDVLGPPRIVGNLFTDENGRILFPATMFLGDAEDIIATAPGTAPALIEWLEKMTFREDAAFAEKKIQHYAWVASSGAPTQDFALRELGITLYHGMNCVAPPSVMTPEQWEHFSIQHGLARAFPEVCVGHNPHEARFADRLDGTKGCYIGQEVVARLETYQKVQRFLVRLELSGPAPAGTPVLLGGAEVGTVSAARGVAALAYVKKEVVEVSTFEVHGQAAKSLPWPQS